MMKVVASLILVETGRVLKRNEIVILTFVLFQGISKIYNNSMCRVVERGETPVVVCWKKTVDA